MIKLFVALLLMGLLGACAGEAEQTQRSTYTDAQGRVQESTNQIKCKRTAGMPLPPGCSGYDYGMGYYGSGIYPAGYYISGTPGLLGYQPGSYTRPDGSVGCGRTNIAGADDCKIWAQPLPNQNAVWAGNVQGGGRWLGTGSGYYYNPATNSQGQYGFPSR